MATLPATLEVDLIDSSPPKHGAHSNDDGTVEYLLTHSTTPGRSVAFTPAKEVTIGRDASSCVLSFPEVAVLSRRHCRVFSLGRDVFVHDLSSNGTFLNGKLVGKDNKKVIRTGDVVAVVNPKLPDYNSFCWRFVAPPTDEEGADELGVGSMYELGPVLGTGNFATVRRGTHRKTGAQVAIKIIEKKRFSMQTDFSFSSLQSEVEILRRMNHGHIIRVFDVFDTDKAFTMVLELVSGGDLFDYIVGRCPNPFTEEEARTLFIQLLEAMLYMHSKDVVHRDLKPENILVHVDPDHKLDYRYTDAQKNAPQIPVSKVTLKITDFGLAKFCAEQDVMTTMCGTPAYLAPEVRVAGASSDRRAAGYGWSVDVWSLGVILYILLSGTPPKAPESGLIVFGKQFAKTSEDAKALIQWMLQVNPSMRADLSDIVSHKWVKGCTIVGRELASKKDRLQLAGTMILQPTPTVHIELPGNVTEGEESDNDLPPPSPGKRPREEAVVSVAIWQWKGDLSKPDTEESSWVRYGQTDSDNIEKMQARGVKTCKVGNGDYRVSFEGMFQYNKSDTSKQRPVRRILETKPISATPDEKRNGAPPSGS
jgi:serine/threonine protein kinase